MGSFFWPSFSWSLVSKPIWTTKISIIPSHRSKKTSQIYKKKTPISTTSTNHISHHLMQGIFTDTKMAFSTHQKKTSTSKIVYQKYPKRILLQNNCLLSHSMYLHHKQLGIIFGKPKSSLPEADLLQKKTAEVPLSTRYRSYYRQGTIYVQTRVLLNCVRIPHKPNSAQSRCQIDLIYVPEPTSRRTCNRGNS